MPKNFSTRKIQNNTPENNSIPNQKENWQEFYRDSLDKPPKIHNRTLIVGLVVTILFTFLTSVLVVFMLFSGVFYQSKFFSWLDISSMVSNANIIIQKQEKNTVVEEEYLNDLYQEITPCVVGIFLTDDKTTYYQETNFVGSGMIMTSDGWIVSANSNFSSKNTYVVINNSGQVFPIIESKTDEALGLIYFKIKADNLPVLNLADYSKVANGSKLLISAGLTGVNDSLNNNRLNSKYLTLTEKNNWETEKNYLMFGLENNHLDKKFIGAPAVNYNKEVVGLVMNNNGSNYLLPAAYFKKNFNQLLTLKKTMATYLGLEYLDMVKNISSTTTKRGAVVLTIKNNSPLWQKIAVGDIILKINNDILDLNNNLSNLIQQYRPGDEITVNYYSQKEKQEQNITIELK